MSYLDTYDSTNRPQASGNSGLAIFRSDTKQIEVSDGNAWQVFYNDGSFTELTSNEAYAVFDGTNDGLNINTLSNHVQNAFTIGGYFFPISSTGTGANPILTGGTSASYVLHFGYDYADSKFGFVSRASAGSFFKGTQINPSQWTHVVVTHNGDTTATIYYNGVQVATNADQRKPTSTSTSNLSIGHRVFDNVFFNGYMDDVFIYDRELTESEISTIYVQRKHTDFKALFRFENNFNDVSGNFNGIEIANSTIVFDNNNLPY